MKKLNVNIVFIYTKLKKRGWVIKTTKNKYEIHNRNGWMNSKSWFEKL